ncbi:MAG: hypothetical protein ACKVVT_19105 [Dehalococcoidia bacterium]
MAYPLAYLLTWTSYATWLPGDARGAVDDGQTVFGEERVSPNSQRVAFLEAKSGPRVEISSQMRWVIDGAIRRLVDARGWTLFALNIRTTHVHAVVAAEVRAEIVLVALKAAATRSLRAATLVAAESRVWTKHGSTRYLWDDDQMTRAVDYVVNRQGAPLEATPVFGQTEP